MANFKEILVNTLLPVIQAMASEQLVGLLNKYAENDKENYSKSVTSLYVVMDGHLEDLAKKSKGKIDDTLIQALKSAIEESADQNGVDLPDLDKD